MTAAASRPSLPKQRRNGPETRRRIILAAQRLFATRGYANTRLRDIAEVAGVAVSLLPQHFGSKEELFEAALAAAMSASLVLDTPNGQLANALIEHSLTDGEDTRLPAMLALSIADKGASQVASRIVREHMIPGLAARLGNPDGEDRALEIMMIASGFLLYARQLPLGTVSPTVAANVADAIQRVLDRST